MNSTENALRQIELDHLNASEAKSAIASLQAVTAQRDTLSRELARVKDEMNELSNSKRQSDLFLIAAKHELDELHNRDAMVSRENLKVLQSARSSVDHLKQENSDLKSQKILLEQEMRRYTDEIVKLKQHNMKLSDDLSSVQGDIFLKRILFFWKIRSNNILSQYSV